MKLYYVPYNLVNDTGAGLAEEQNCSIIATLEWSPITVTIPASGGGREGGGEREGGRIILCISRHARHLPAQQQWSRPASSSGEVVRW